MYPLYLIPQEEDKIFSIEEIDKSHHLARYVEGSIELKNGHRLSSEAVDIAQLPGFSTNKIPPTQLEDLNIFFLPDYNKIYREHWEEGEKGVLPPNEHFSYDTNRNFFLMQILDIEGYSSSVIRADKKNTPFNFTLCILHTPLISNFWHFEFYIKGEEGEIARIEKRGYRNAIGANIRSRIISIAKFEIAS